MQAVLTGEIGIDVLLIKGGVGIEVTLAKVISLLCRKATPITSGRLRGKSGYIQSKSAHLYRIKGIEEKTREHWAQSPELSF